VIAALVVAILAACDPMTTRPDLVPFPESRTIEVELERPLAIARLRDALVADTFPIAKMDTYDAWLETPWFDRGTLQPAAPGTLGIGTVKLRAFAEPSRPGHALLVIELSWRPMADPSVPARELERPVPADDLIAKRVNALLDRLAGEIGAPPPRRARSD
jgi:hypothetical protein